MGSGLTAYRKIQRETRKAWAKGLKSALDTLRGRGLTYEQIAVDLKVTRDTVDLWATEKRCPKYPTIRYIESHYGVKIL